MASNTLGAAHGRAAVDHRLQRETGPQAFHMKEPNYYFERVVGEPYICSDCDREVVTVQRYGQVIGAVHENGNLGCRDPLRASYQVAQRIRAVLKEAADGK